MVSTINSFNMYQDACAYSLHYGNIYRNKNTTWFKTDFERKLEIHYIKIILMMFKELIVKKDSPLLSYMCLYNQIGYTPTHFNIVPMPIKRELPTLYDIWPLLEGLNYIFENNIVNCRACIVKYGRFLFCNMSCNENDPWRSEVSRQLRCLDEKIRDISFDSVQGDVIKSEPGKTGGFDMKRKSENIKTIRDRDRDPKLTDEFNKYAEERKRQDSALSEKIQRLQLSLQDELKEIKEIREQIDYNTMQEAISQFLRVYDYIGDVLSYHLNNKTEESYHNSIESYHNLVESCEILMENIEQSLSVLGVKIIDNINVALDPDRHKVRNNLGDVRGRRIAKIIKKGFEYKDKVVQKAEVEIG